MNYELIADELFDLTEHNRRCEQAMMKRVYLSAENYVLMMIVRNQEGIVYAGSLSAYIACKTSRMSVILNSLEKEGYITRVPDANDNRKHVIVATEVGKEKGIKLLEEVRRSYAELLKKLGEEDVRQLLTLQRKISKLYDEDYQNE